MTEFPTKGWVRGADAPSTRPRATALVGCDVLTRRGALCHSSVRQPWQARCAAYCDEVEQQHAHFLAGLAEERLQTDLGAETEQKSRARRTRKTTARPTERGRTSLTLTPRQLVAAEVRRAAARGDVERLEELWRDHYRLQPDGTLAFRRALAAGGLLRQINPLQFATFAQQTLGPRAGWALVLHTDVYSPEQERQLAQLMPLRREVVVDMVANALSQLDAAVRNFESRRTFGAGAYVLGTLRLFDLLAPGHHLRVDDTFAALFLHQVAALAISGLLNERLASDIHELLEAGIFPEAEEDQTPIPRLSLMVDSD